eukprot:CAMPEP_0205833088 /NCGR_PEP_ID=MMETSP0206-20130828/48726_1 /ASSEMBLY_ACC=CAM_ASM_000279 /TAXON_ID=36767 /ORGANISM="Euplotes focardii, Strain TN1" /LENGTH=144 /DNA_ID=CAMNT_0053139167 /DNA_START=703 /DNA_END=1137 /DNA_ORIENTATION=-
MDQKLAFNGANPSPLPQFEEEKKGDEIGIKDRSLFTDNDLRKKSTKANMKSPTDTKLSSDDAKGQPQYSPHKADKEPMKLDDIEQEDEENKLIEDEEGYKHQYSEGNGPGYDRSMRGQTKLYSKNTDNDFDHEIDKVEIGKESL